jgi:hypothetical protein
MDDKPTHIKVDQDSPTGTSSKAHGANVDAVAFNISFIASKNPTLSVQILKLYADAYKISPSDPPHPDEDFELALGGLPDPFKK